MTTERPVCHGSGGGGWVDGCWGRCMSGVMWTGDAFARGWPADCVGHAKQLIDCGQPKRGPRVASEPSAV